MHKIHILVLIGSGLMPAQQAQHLVELVEARIVERQAAAALLCFEGDPQPEDRRELALKRYGVGITRTPL